MLEHPSKRRFRSRSDAGRNLPSQWLLLQRTEWIVAILLSSLILFLLAVRTMHAGPLWRDECDAVQLAEMPRFADVLANLKYSSFPVLFPAILRAYIALCGGSDLALRCFAFIVGALFVAAAWVHSLSESRQPPLLLLALIGLNLNFLTAGMWIRGYGIGAVFLLGTFTLVARLIRRTTTAGFGAVCLASVAGAQCLFFDGVLMQGIFLGGLAVLFLDRQFKWALLLAGLALVILLGYVPYSYRVMSFLGHVDHIGRATPVQVAAVSSASSWRGSMGACGAPTFVMPWVWLTVILGTAIGSACRLILIWNKKSGGERDVLLFALIVIASSILLFWGFFQWIRMIPLQRYYLALFCLLAAAADLALAHLCRFHWLRLVRISTVLIGTMTLPFAVWPQVLKRETNIDILAEKLEKEAGSNDLILVNSWSRGISFNRYYHGPTRWMTVPNIQDHRMHRYDLLGAKMQEFFPIADIEEAIATTLKSGNRVWVVNDSKVNVKSGRALVLTPAPDPKFGWRADIYSYAWAQQLFLFLQRHAGKINVPMRPQSFVSNNNENASLIRAEGWEY